MPELRSNIESGLKAFGTTSLRQAALDLLSTLGYQSDKTVELEGSTPQAFLDLLAQSNPDALFDKEKALFNDWSSIDLLFQLTDDELSTETSLFEETEVKPGLLKSYLFFAIELNGKSAVNGAYARGKLTAIARQINRVFPMPVMMLIKHPHLGKDALSIAVINRRANKREAYKDVLGKVTIIRDISLTEPHRGHLDILDSFATPNLIHPDNLQINSFDTLHTAWERIFNVELLNKNFYDELANWFFWAKRHSRFPLYDLKADKYDLFHDSDKAKEHEAKNLIRLLTRTLFVWFIKERGLVPGSLFSPADLKKAILKSFDPESKETIYYKAILQNLFFATLNQTHGEREFRKEGQHQNTTTLLRYKDYLKAPDDFVQVLEGSTPFLNGGLFECLDRPHPTKKGPHGGKVIIYEDGFSDREDNQLQLPDFLLFGKERIEDLSGEDAFGLANKCNAKVRGLVHILDSYKFTIVENTPIDQEIALDPELLGQVFENLLASYNPETKTTARKQTGSFYTPRPIVDYMVDKSLRAYLKRALIEDAKMKAADADAGLELLFAYNDRDNPFEKPQTDVLIRAIDNCEILDPACGSGAFPMGALQKLVYVLSKLDPGDELWEQRQLAKVDRIIEAAHEIDDPQFQERAIAEAQAQKKDIENAFAKNELGYGRKLYLIENCLYGVDIQSIATQVTKLRFFISLIVDQTMDRRRTNFGVRPLPNLETKFVTADSLIQVERPQNQGELSNIAEVSSLQCALKQVRHSLFRAKTPHTKNKYREKDRELRDAIAEELKKSGWVSDDAENLAAWDPYDQNASAPYFDPEWMFGLKLFDIVIGNPPYIQIQKFPKKQKNIWVGQEFETYAAAADIYCLFYERGSRLLKDGGTLAYITSNKYYRSGYGAKLRDYLAREFTITEMLDFGDAPVFDAIAYASIFVGKLKTAPEKNTLKAWTWQHEEKIEEVAAVMHDKAFLVEQTNLTRDGWRLDRPEVFELLRKLKNKGRPLKEYVAGRFYYGIKTGFNEAFVVDRATRDRLIAEDPNSHDLLKPFLRGRDIKRWESNWAGYYLIKIESSQNTRHPWSELELEQAERIFERTYPSIYMWFQSFKGKTDNQGINLWERLLNRADQGKYYWELRACAYWDEFNQEQIGWGNLATKSQFSPIEPGFISCAPAVVAVSEPWISSILNSAVSEYLISMAGAERQNGFYEFKPMYVGPLPIPDVTKKTREELSSLTIQAANQEGDALTKIESKINKIIFSLFDLNEKEIELINRSINTKS